MRLVNKDPTRFEGNVERGLDHFYTNKIDKLFKFSQSEFTTSDHSQLEYDRHMKINVCEEQYILTRQWNKINFETINENIINDENYLNALEDDNSDRIANYIVEQINKNLDAQSELRKVKVSKNKDQKYSNETLEIIKEKNKLYKKYKSEKKVEDKIHLKNLTKVIDQRKRTENKDNNKKEFEKCNGKSKNEWRVAKEKLFGTREAHPERVLENNKIVNGAKKVAGVFNRFFVSKVRKIRESIPEQYEDPMIHYKKFVKSPKRKLYFPQINMMQLKKKMNKMKKSNSVSFDLISMNTISKLKDSIYLLLLQLINVVNKTKHFPNILKVSRIFPIRKSMTESPLDCSNWRPVNLLSPISKIIERFWISEIIKHLKDNKLIEANHQGGLSNRSSTTTVLEIFNKLAKAKMKKKHSAVISTDQSGAFDVIFHPLLLSKLEHIGFSNEATSTIKSFLSDRKQFVQINTQNSDILLTGPVSTVQGSVMSGILYCIFIHDMSSVGHNKSHINNSSYNNCKRANINTFVDDCYSTIMTDNKDEIWNLITEYVKRMNRYYTNNCLKNNIKKPRY